MLIGCQPPPSPPPPPPEEPPPPLPDDDPGDVPAAVIESVMALLNALPNPVA